MSALGGVRKLGSVLMSAFPGGTIDHLGVKLPRRMPILSPKIRRAIEDGSYEQGEAAQIGAIIQEGERVLEIGVGIGFLSTLILKNPLVSAYLGVEANPALLPWIRKVFALNGVEGELLNCILDHHEGEGETDFYLREDFWASSLEKEPWGYESVARVPTRNFNDLLREFRPTLVVCDIEGGEGALFDSADLAGVKKIYLEIHQQVLGREGVRRLFMGMAEKGFHYDQWHSAWQVVLFSHVERD